MTCRVKDGILAALCAVLCLPAPAHAGDISANFGSGAIIVGTGPACGSGMQGMLQYVSGGMSFCDGTSWSHVSASLDDLSPSVTAINAVYTIAATDKTILATLSTAGFTITFPTAVGAKGRVITIKRTDNTAYALTLAAYSGQTIEGASSISMAIKAGVSFVSDGANWLAYSLMMPATAHALYYPVTNKAGDTLTNPTSDTAFASKYTIPANALSVGQKIYIKGRGHYSIPTGTLFPQATIKIRLGSTVLMSSSALSIGLGTGVDFGFALDGTLVVQSIGSSGTIVTGGSLTIQVSSGLSPSFSTVIVDTGNLTIDTTVAQNITVTAKNSPSAAAATFKLTDLDITTTKMPSAAD